MHLTRPFPAFDGARMNNFHSNNNSVVVFLIISDRSYNHKHPIYVLYTNVFFNRSMSWPWTKPATETKVWRQVVHWASSGNWPSMAAAVHDANPRPPQYLWIQWSLKKVALPHSCCHLFGESVYARARTRSLARSPENSRSVEFHSMLCITYFSQTNYALFSKSEEKWKIETRHHQRKKKLDTDL